MFELCRTDERNKCRTELALVMPCKEEEDKLVNANEEDQRSTKVLLSPFHYESGRAERGVARDTKYFHAGSIILLKVVRAHHFYPESFVLSSQKS